MIECEYCHKLFDQDKEEISFDCDPFDCEIRDIHDQFWLCCECWRASAWEI